MVGFWLYIQDEILPRNRRDSVTSSSSGCSEELGGFKNVFWVLFLGRFAKLITTIISSVMSVSLCVSVCPLEQLGCHWKDFYEI